MSATHPNPQAHLPSHLCYLNGQYTPLNRASVSVLDRGFIFGDGVYEVLAVYGARVFRFEQHMQRLERSLGQARIAQPLGHAQWHEIATKLIASYAMNTGATDQKGFKVDAARPVTAPVPDHLIYLQVTRGVAMRDHVMPQGIAPTVFAMINPMTPASPQARAQGVACVSADDFRWKKAHIKTTSLLSAVLSRQMSFDADAVETVMFRDGFLSEAAASNVWIVKDNTVLGPVKDNLVLEGIRYGLIEGFCRSLGLKFELRPISREEVFKSDELLLSSATKEILPVTRLDEQVIGNGKPGPIYQQLYAAYQAAKLA